MVGETNLYDMNYYQVVNNKHNTIARYEKQVASDDSNRYALKRLAFAYKSIYNQEGALEAFRKLTKLEPNDAENYWFSGNFRDL